jgi:hypothetical protein
MVNMLQYDFFISHSGEDKHIAEELVRCINEKGKTCYMAALELKPGDKWADEIRDAIERSRGLLLLITPRSINKPWILIETGSAWLLRKKIVPVLNLVSPSEIEKIDILRNYQAHVIDTINEREEFVNKLVEGIESIKIAGAWENKKTKEMLIFDQRGDKAVGLHLSPSNEEIGYYEVCVDRRESKYEYIYYDAQDAHTLSGVLSVSEDNRCLSGAKGVDYTYVDANIISSKISRLELRWEIWLKKMLRKRSSSEKSVVRTVFIDRNTFISPNDTISIDKYLYHYSEKQFKEAISDLVDLGYLEKTAPAPLTFSVIKKIPSITEADLSNED